MAKPRFLHRRIDDSYHSFCLSCFRIVDSQEEEGKLAGSEHIHTCDPHDVLCLDSAEALTLARRMNLR